MICKADKDYNGMIAAGAIVRDAHLLAGKLAKVGISTKELDKRIEKFIIDSGAIPSFKNYGGFPASICASVNDVVVHGIPDDYVLQDGDILSVDIGAEFNGYHGDAARTLLIGNVKTEIKELVKVTEECFFKGIEMCKIGGHINDIGEAIQNHAESFNYGVVRELVGHGIGKSMHESPEVPNFKRESRGAQIKENMCLAIEPMINLGTRRVYMEVDGFTIKTFDGLCSAHYENTVIVTKSGVVITTL